MRLNKLVSEIQSHGSSSTRHQNSFPCFAQAHLSQIPQTPKESKILDSELFGLIKFQDLPPSDLHLPMLTFKHQSKHFFFLCRSCVEGKCGTLDRRSMDFTSNLCSHFETWKRGFLGIFETPEIQLALENNYRILDVAEVRIWKPDKISFSLFKDFINTFLKIKAVASGWPKEARCDTEIDPDSTLPNRLCDHKRAFLGELEQKEGLVIDEKKTFAKMRVSSSRRNPVPE